jgi:hypothetical protein
MRIFALNKFLYKTRELLKIKLQTAYLIFQPSRKQLHVCTEWNKSPYYTTIAILLKESWSVEIKFVQLIHWKMWQKYNFYFLPKLRAEASNLSNFAEIQNYWVGRKILHFPVIFWRIEKLFKTNDFFENQRDQVTFAKFISILTKLLFLARKWQKRIPNSFHHNCDHVE